MKYVKFTYVDSVTGVSVAEAPAINGPSLPFVEGIKFGFALESQYPTDVAIMYGTCTSASTDCNGVLEVISKLEYETDREIEMQTRADKRLLEPVYEGEVM